MKPTKNDKPKGEFFIRSCDYGVEDDKRTIKGVIPYNSDSVVHLIRPLQTKQKLSVCWATM